MAIADHGVVFDAAFRDDGGCWVGRQTSSLGVDLIGVPPADTCRQAWPLRQLYGLMSGEASQQPLPLSDLATQGEFNLTCTAVRLRCTGRFEFAAGLIYLIAKL